MTSINTNLGAQTALQALNSINSQLGETQSRIATGYRVSTAADNAAYWSMATTLRSDNKSLSAVSDALGLGAALVDVTYTAMESSIDVVSELKSKLVAAREPGVDRAKVQTEVDELQNQLRGIAAAANFAGENWLSVDTTGTGTTYTATESIVSSFTRSSNANGATVSVGTISVDISSTFLFNADGGTSAGADEMGILGSARYSIADSDTNNVAQGSIDASGTIVIASADGTSEIDIASATDAQLDDYISAVDAALTEMTTAATDLGSSKARIDLQKDFVSSLMDSIDRGIASLVDADMNAESTRLQALQTQQQLGVQALSIANSQSQNILSLFR
ncbi:MAG: flagellin [Pseudomonadota bacterium]